MRRLSWQTFFSATASTTLPPAERLALELEASGHAVWFGEWEINMGDSIAGRIDQGLQGATSLVLCYSSSGMSAWVNREWMSAVH